MRFQTVLFRRLRRPAAAALSALILLTGAVAVPAEEIAVEDLSPDEGETVDPSVPQDAFDVDDGALFEDTGDEIIDMSGISEDAVFQESETSEDVIVIPNLEDAQPDRIRQTLDSLLQTPSLTGTEGELVIAQFIEDRMKELGYAVQEQAFHEGVLNEEGIDPPGVNIIAERGADSKKNRKDDILLLVTHYDSKRSPDERDPYANDKTGAAVLLEAARILAHIETDTDLCFLFLSGQEDGGYGAKAFIDSLSEANRSRITGVLAVDRVGYDTGMPNVIKTWTGDANDIAALVQESGIWQEAGLILDGVRPLPEDLSSTEDPLSGEETALADDTALAGDTALSGDTALADGAEPEDGIAPETEADDSAETKIPAVWSCLMDPYVVSPNADPVSNPDLNSIQSIFADAGFPSAQVTQYDPERDLELYQQTIDLDLADLTASDLADTVLERLNEGIYNTSETFNDVEILGLEDSILSQDTSLAGDTVPGTEAAEQADTETETETETEIRLPETDPVLLAQNADVLAEVLAYIMDAE